MINRFRGDLALLEPGLEWLERECGKPVLGVLPYLNGLVLDAEDALPEAEAETGRPRFRIAVPVYPRISNHTDFDALRLHPGVELVLVGPGDALPAADLVILPGSKNVRADLEFLRRRAGPTRILRHVRYGGRVIGICGGMQMLGTRIDDPQGVEGPAGSSDGLGLAGPADAFFSRKSSCATSRATVLGRARSAATRSTWGVAGARAAGGTSRKAEARFPPTAGFSPPMCTASSMRRRRAPRCSNGPA